MGGTITAVRMHGDAFALLMLEFPDESVVDVAGLIDGTTFLRVHARTITAVQDQGITYDD